MIQENFYNIVPHMSTTYSEQPIIAVNKANWDILSIFHDFYDIYAGIGAHLSQYTAHEKYQMAVNHATYGHH